MKIHICADMEGTCGVYSWMQVTPPDAASSGPINEAEYDRCRSRMTAEVSAAARGAFWRMAQPRYWSMTSTVATEISASTNSMSVAGWQAAARDR